MCCVLLKAERKGPHKYRESGAGNILLQDSLLLKDSKHDEFLFATEFMKIDDSLCGGFN